MFDKNTLVQATIVTFPNKQKKPETLKFVSEVTNSSILTLQTQLLDSNSKEIMKNWLDNAMRKSIRKIPSMNKFNQVYEDELFKAYPKVIPTDELAVFTLPISKYSSLPTQVAKAQVSDLILTTKQTLFTQHDANYKILIDESLNMSAGKMAAQCSHLGTLALMESVITEDTHDGFSYQIVSHERFMDEKPLYTVVDNGHTEVDPGTNTVKLVKNDLY